jgi:regulatory protein
VVHRRSARYGAARIEHELVGKGLDPQAISKAMSALQGSELERARAIWVRKFREPSQELKEQARQMRFLMGRGFSPEVAQKVTRGQ